MCGKRGRPIPSLCPWPAVPDWLYGLGNPGSGLEWHLGHFFLPPLFSVLGISQIQSIEMLGQ